MWNIYSMRLIYYINKGTCVYVYATVQERHSERILLRALRSPKSNLIWSGRFCTVHTLMDYFQDWLQTFIIASHNVFPSLVFILQLLLDLRPKKKNKKIATQQPSKNIYSVFYIIKSDRLKKNFFSVVIVCDGMKRGFEIIHKVFKEFL